MSLKRSFNKVRLDIKKASPAIMVAAGIAFSVGAIVEFCRKSREGLPVIDEYKETLAELTESHNTVVAFAEKEGKADIIKTEHRTYCKDVATETTKTVVKLGRIYAKPIALYAISVGLNIKSYQTMRNRNVALAAAYAGLGNEIRHVYSRIAEKYGDEALYEIKHGIKKVEVEETRIDEATGSEVVDKKLVPAIETSSGDPNLISPYARFFNDTCAPWKDDPEYNLTYLLEVEADLNRILRTEGHLFLNTVYDKLGMKRSRAGQMVGWTYYKNGKNPHGDNYVSLGLHNIRRVEVQDFVNGYESVILIDPNVDGEIIDSIDW